MRPLIKRLHDRAWITFSRWIRNRDKKCVTCGSPSQEAGHYWHNVLDFDEVNINGQCSRCNHYLSGNLAPYAVYLIKKHGIKEFRKLDIRHTLALKGEKRSEEDYRQLIEKYRHIEP